MSDNPYQPPASKGAAHPDEPDLASPAIRLVAVIIESLVLLPITIPIAYLMGNLDGLRTGQPPAVLNQLAGTLVSLGVFIGINWVFLPKGQTIGKKAVGVRIESLEGSLLPVKRLLLARYLPWWAVSVVPVVGPLLAFIDVLFIFGRDRRCIHDHIARTRVVKVQPR